MFEFVSRFGRREAPLYGGLFCIAACLPSGERATDRPPVAQPPIQALGRHHRELDFGHIEPTAVLGGVVEIQLPQNAARFHGRKSGRQRGGSVRVQVIQYDANHHRVGEMDVHQVFHRLCKVVCRAPVSDLDMPPAPQRLEAQEQVTAPFPMVFVVIPRRLPRSGRQGLADLTHQLVGAFIETDYRIVGIIGLGIEVQDIFHVPHEVRAYAWDTPGLLLPRLERVFLSVRRTVSSEMASITRSSTSLSASNCIVHDVRPSGGVLQARATRNASCLPSSLRCPPGRGRSHRAASRPSSTKRLRTRSTVAMLTWSAAAMAASMPPASAWSRMWARVSLRAATFPFLVRAIRCARSSSVKVTMYRLAIGSSPFWGRIPRKGQLSKSVW